MTAHTKTLATNEATGNSTVSVPSEANVTAARLAKIHRLQATLTSSPWSHDLIELALATATSLPVSLSEDTALVWLLIAGPPASDKTETTLLLRGASNIYFLDTLTENSFISGYRDPKTGVPAEDLLPELHQKCLVIKDLTTLFSLRDDKVRKILGELQSIYDGEYAKFMGTRGGVKYESKFSMVCCITPIALSQHHRYMSLIGSRFLVYRVLPLTDEERAKGFALSWGLAERKHSVAELRKLVAEHVGELCMSASVPKAETPEQRQTIEQLALLLARGRAVLKYRRSPRLDDQTGRETWTYEIEQIQTEEPWRAFQQLRNLSRALARVHGRTSITDHELEILRRVVLSSIPVDRAEVLALFSGRSEGLTREGCSKGIDKGYGRAKQVLDELVAVKLLVVKEAPAEPRPRLLYLTVPELAGLICKPVEALDHVADLREGAVTQNSPQDNGGSMEGFMQPVTGQEKASDESTALVPAADSGGPSGSTAPSEVAGGDDGCLPPVRLITFDELCKKVRADSGHARGPRRGRRRRMAWDWRSVHSKCLGPGRWQLTPVARLGT